MSKIAPSRPRPVAGQRSFAIVASQFNAVFVRGLVDHASAELRECAPSAPVALYEVPGAFEIPVVVRELALRKNFDAIIAVGVILKGHTTHAENLSRSVTDALQQIAVEQGVPVINVVLSMENEAQARERCLEDKINRGTEAGRAAMAISDLMAGLREKQNHG